MSGNDLNLDRKLALEEKKAVKFFIWLFYIIYFLYEFFYDVIRPYYTDKRIGLPQDGMGVWIYVLLLAMLPFGIYLIKKGKQHYVKYIFFINYTILDFINVLMIVFARPHATLHFGNVLDIFLILFASIFVNKRYVYIISLGTIMKYAVIGLVAKEINVILPIGILTFLLIFSLVILARFTSYINALTSMYEEVRNKEKLAFIGQISTSIGHEIRNPLSALKGFTQLQQEIDIGDKNFYPIMIQEIDRINEIVDDLMVLGKPKQLIFEKNDLKEIIDYVTTVTLQLANNYGSQVIANNLESTKIVECNEKQLKQALINLIKNALEAMPNGGTVRVNTHEKGKDKILIEIQDDGCGIGPEKLKKLGEPFYTTKPDGTGLGILITKKIIEDHNGEILFDSKEGKGTKVTIIIPVSHKNN